MSYHVHELLHIAEDAKNLGNLEENSAYVYESFFGKLKDKLHSFNNPLQQCHNRLQELSHIKNYTSDSFIELKNVTQYPILTKSLNNDPNVFTVAKFELFEIRTKKVGDKFLMLNDLFLRVDHFKREEESIIVVGENLVDRKQLNAQPQNLKHFMYLTGKFETTFTNYKLSECVNICKICVFPSKLLLHLASLLPDFLPVYWRLRYIGFRNCHQDRLK